MSAETWKYVRTLVTIFGYRGRVRIRPGRA